MITVEEKNAAVSESDQKGQTAGKESRAQAEGGERSRRIGSQSGSRKWK